MKVAVVINTSWNIYNFRQGLVEALIKKGYKLFAFAPEDEFSSKLGEIGMEFHALPMDNQGVNPVKDLKLIWRMFRLYKRIKPDVILHYTIKPNIYGSIAAYLAGIPSINNVSGLGTVFLKDNWLAFLSRWLYRFSFRFPYRVFFQNKDDQKLFIENKLVNPDKTDIVAGSGINLSRFQPKPVPDGKTVIFLLISRLIQDKGIREFIESVKILKSQSIDARFQLLGPKDPDHKRGIPVEEIEEWIEKGIIEYLGKTEDVRPHILSAHCIILPSYREGTPRTLLEGAALGRPLIATNVPGCREVIEEGRNGYLCNVKDPEDLSEKMMKFYSSSPELKIKLGEYSRYLVETKFDEIFVINKYLETISNLSKN